MSSSSRTILRGAAARRVQPAPFDLNLEDLSVTMTDGGASAEALAAADHASGFEAGYRDGHAAGVAAAQAEAEAALAVHAARLEQAVRALSEAARQLQSRAAVEVEAIENQLTEAAFTIAEAVVGRELELVECPGRDAVARALAVAPPGPAVVRLNPAEIDTVTGDFGRELTLVADPSVEPAGCIVEIGACTIDAQIGPALERVREVLA